MFMQVQQGTVCYIGTMFMQGVGYQAPGSKSPTQVHTNVHCCHWLPKELSKKGYQTYQGVENP